MIRTIYIAVVGIAAIVASALGLAGLAHSATGISKEAILGASGEYIQTENYINLVNSTLAEAGKHTFVPVVVGATSEVQEAMAKNPGTMVFSVQQTMEMINGSPELGPGSRFKPAFDDGQAGWMWQAFIHGWETTSDVARLQQACYGWHSVKQFSTLTGLGPQQSDLDALNAWIDHIFGEGSSKTLASAYTAGEEATTLAACDALLSTD